MDNKLIFLPPSLPPSFFPFPAFFLLSFHHLLAHTLLQALLGAECSVVSRTWEVAPRESLTSWSPAVHFGARTRWTHVGPDSNSMEATGCSFCCSLPQNMNISTLGFQGAENDSRPQAVSVAKCPPKKESSSKSSLEPCELGNVW